jgi:signal transduction histidine kinase
MKSLTVDLQDEETLRDLGSASVQVVHDLKNQLNGLKLYATFLRKRLEKGERPADELETVGKLIAGLERAATDMNALVRLGRPLDLRRQPGTDLSSLLEAAAEGRAVHAEAGTYEGEFDAAALKEAFEGVGKGALRALEQARQPDALTLHLRRDETGDAPAAVIEWRGVKRREEGDGDAFKSFDGSAGMRMAFAARVIRAHGGSVAHEADTLRARLPLEK